jgi:hypothetical protein
LRLEKLFLFAPERDTVPVGAGAAGTKVLVGVKIDTVGKLVVLRDEVEVEVEVKDDESVSVVSVAESECVDLVRVLLSDSVVEEAVVDSVSEYDVVVCSSV